MDFDALTPGEEPVCIAADSQPYRALRAAVLAGPRPQFTWQAP